VNFVLAEPTPLRQIPLDRLAHQVTGSLGARCSSSAAACISGSRPEGTRVSAGVSGFILFAIASRSGESRKPSFFADGSILSGRKVRSLPWRAARPCCTAMQRGRVSPIRFLLITHQSHFEYESRRRRSGLSATPPRFLVGPESEVVQPLEPILLFIAYVSDASYSAAFCLNFYEIWT